MAPTESALAENEFDAAKLAQYKEAPIYIAVKGKVFDVTDGAKFYGPGAGYSCFAGMDATYGLAKSEVSALPNQPLTVEEEQVLDGWVSTFTKKYRVVGVYR